MRLGQFVHGLSDVVSRQKKLREDEHVRAHSARCRCGTAYLLEVRRLVALDRASLVNRYSPHASATPTSVQSLRAQFSASSKHVHFFLALAIVARVSRMMRTPSREVMPSLSHETETLPRGRRRGCWRRLSLL